MLIDVSVQILHSSIALFTLQNEKHYTDFLYHSFGLVKFFKFKVRKSQDSASCVSLDQIISVFNIAQASVFQSFLVRGWESLAQALQGLHDLLPAAAAPIREKDSITDVLQFVTDVAPNQLTILIQYELNSEIKIT